jgi:hypothetical protein
MKFGICSIGFIILTCHVGLADEDMFKQLSSDDLAVRKKAAQVLLTENKINISEMPRLINELKAAQSTPDKQKFLLSFIVAAQNQFLIQSPDATRHASLSLKKDVFDTVRPLVGSEDSTVKEYAYIMLGLYEVEDASEEFLAKQYTIEGEAGKVSVIKGVGYTDLSSNKVKDILASALKSNSSALFEEACVASVRTNYRSGLSELISRLSDENAQIAESAVSALEKFPQAEISGKKREIEMAAELLPNGPIKERIAKLSLRSFSAGN